MVKDTLESGTSGHFETAEEFDNVIPRSSRGRRSVFRVVVTLVLVTVVVIAAVYSFNFPSSSGMTASETNFSKLKSKIESRPRTAVDALHSSSDGPVDSCIQTCQDTSDDEIKLSLAFCEHTCRKTGDAEKKPLDTAEDWCICCPHTFCLAACCVNPASKPPSGYYWFIESRQYPGKFMGVNGVGYGTSVHLYTKTQLHADKLKWEFIHISSKGWFVAKNKFSGLVMDISGNSKRDSADLHTWGYHGGDNQRFGLYDPKEASGKVYYTIEARESQKSLDTPDGVRVYQWRTHRHNNQQWRVYKTERVPNCYDHIGAVSDDESSVMEDSPLTAADELSLHPDPATFGKTDQVLAVKGNVGWHHIPGKLMNVAIDKNGQIWGVNSGHHIFTRTKQAYHQANWIHVEGRLMEISVSFNGLLVTGVNVNHHIFYRHGISPQHVAGTSWGGQHGGLKDVSTGDHRIYGVNTHDTIYRKKTTDPHWCAIPGKLMQISAHGKNIVGVNSNEDIFKYLGDGLWDHIAGKAVWASMGEDGEFWVVNRHGNIYRRQGSAWTQIAGSLKQIDVANAGNIVGVNSADDIYVYA